MRWPVGEGRKTRAQWRKRAVVASMLAPSATGIVAFTLAPVACVAVWSFTRFDIVSSPHYVGLGNYRFALHDPFLAQAIENTLWMLAVGAPIQLGIALGLGMLLARGGPATGIARTAVFLPAALPPVAATLVFGWLLQPGNGPLDQLLGVLHLHEPLWFYDPRWSKPGLLVLALWGIGPVVILYIAGLVRIPRRLYDVAELEGASRFHQFRRITLPMLTPILLFTFVLSVVNALEYFTQAYVAAATAAPGVDPLIGSPQGSTRFYAGEIYEQGFVLGHFGYASTLAWLLFVLTVVVMGALLWVSRRLPGASAIR